MLKIMKNNKGFGPIEILIILAVLITGTQVAIGQKQKEGKFKRVHTDQDMSQGNNGVFVGGYQQ